VNHSIGDQRIYKFRADISAIDIPEKLNNPFDSYIPEIARVAAKEFQEAIQAESAEWEHDFSVDNGKMFGILVVQRKDKTYGYLRGVSGTLPGKATGEHMVPSIFDDSADDYFIHKGMIVLTEMTDTIKGLTDEEEIAVLKEKRKEKSFALQQQLFSHYRFSNQRGEVKNVVEIFRNSSHGNPPSAAGDCAAPKLLQYAFEHRLKPIAIAEFWWGNPPKNKERKQGEYYPACKNKCRPILEYMLDDKRLFDQGIQSFL